LELEEALRQGYVITHFDRAYHWDEWATDLFKGYIKEFMALKLQVTNENAEYLVKKKCLGHRMARRLQDS